MLLGTVLLLLTLTGPLLITAQLQGTIRLNNDGDRSRINSGRLEIYVNGVWGTVCDDGFGFAEANVACRQLGYPDVLFYGNVGNLRFSAGSGTIWLDDLNCGSLDVTIASCRTSSYGFHNCEHSEDVALICVGEGTVRLTTSSGYGSSLASTNDGRLEIYAGGQWGTVCDDSFAQGDANVACNQLGFPYASSYGDVFLSNDNIPILLDDITCFSNDDYLLECSHSGVGRHNCVHSEDVELTCSTIPLNSVVGAAVGGTIGAIIVLTIIAVACCCVCYSMTKSSSTRNRQIIVQPHTHTTTTATATTTAAYPMQPTAPSTYPTQQYPQTVYPTAQPTPQNMYGQQSYPAGGHAAPTPYPPQQQPTAYPPQQQPTAYPAGGQVPPAPYPLDTGKPSAYPPGPPGDLSAYNNAPPAYSELQHQ